MPANHLAGRFAPAEELPGGYYRQGNDSGILRSDMTRRDPELGLSGTRTRRESSTDSFFSSTTSVHTPRRVESIIDPGDTLSYFAQQALQRPPGGASYETGRQRQTSAPPISLGNRQFHLRRRSTSAPKQHHSVAAADEPQADRFVRGRSASIDSFRSVGTDSTVSMHFDVPFHHRPREPASKSRGEYNAGSNGQPEASPTSQRRNSAPEISVAAALDVNGACRGRPQSHNGRSPLARKSFVRLATDEVPTSAADDGAQSRVSRRVSSDNEGETRRRGRRRTPTACGSDGRRRLSKQSRAPYSRESSQG